MTLIPLEVHDLNKLLTLGPDQLLILDVRSKLLYDGSHIHASSALFIPNFLLKRKLDFAQFLSRNLDPNVLFRLSNLACPLRIVLCDSSHLEIPEEKITFVANQLEKLYPSRAPFLWLRPGFEEFYREYPSMCDIEPGARSMADIVDSTPASIWKLAHGSPSDCHYPPYSPDTGSTPTWLKAVLMDREQLKTIFKRLSDDEKSRLLLSLNAKSHDDEYSMSAAIDSRDRNRYQNVWPYNFNRYLLANKMVYINASHIKSTREYIATQCPMKTTVNDFWTMVWESHARIILMLCEVDLTLQCDTYWPEKGESFVPGTGLRIFAESFVAFNQCITVRILKMSKLAEHRVVYHIQQHAWPDHGPLKDPDTLLRLNHLVNSIQPDHGTESEKKSPIIVHCSAGCGRTGTFIAMSLILSRTFGDSRSFVDSYHEHDVILETVRELKPQRMLLMQSLNQLEFLYRTFLQRHRLQVKQTYSQTIAEPLAPLLAHLQ